jgi:prepilin-type N-terminal cleavage/methylation domain-containing protein
MKNPAGKMKKGFTLIELMVSIAVFSVVVIVVMQTFSMVIKNYRISRQIQTDNEDLRTAIEIMGKNIRMSSNIKEIGSNDGITMYNNSQGMCVGYKIEQNTLKYAEKTTDDKTNCDSLSDYVTIISSYVNDGKIIVYPRSENRAGLVTITLELVPYDPNGTGANLEQDTARVQTSISTRDYF